MVPERTLNRILFATRYTRHLDRHGYLHFQDWQLYGERGLAHHQVSVWVYEGTLKVEHQAVTLSTYRVELHEDRKHLKSVDHPRLAETVFRSPQLTLFDLGPDEWMVYWKGQPYAHWARKRVMSGVIQPALFDLVELEQAVGAEGAQTLHPWLRVVPKESPTEIEE